MTQFRMVRAEVWLDNDLLEIGPDAMFIYLYLLTGPHSTNITGFSRVPIGGIAEDIGYPVERVSSGYQILSQGGLLMYDEKRKISLLVKEFKCMPPRSDSQIKGCFNTLERIPDCEIKTFIIQELGKTIDPENIKAAAAYKEGVSRGYADGCRVGVDHKKKNKKKEIDKNREKKKEKNTDRSLPESNITMIPVSDSGESGTNEKITSVTLVKPEASESLEANRLYRSMYTDMYGHAPIIGAKDNSIISRIVKRVGKENTLKLIQFYFRSPDQYYKKQGHPLWLLEKQADKIWAELNNPIRAVESLAHNQRSIAVQANNLLEVNKYLERTGNE